MNEEQSNRESNRNDVEDLEEDDSSTSEDDTEEKIVQPQTTTDLFKAGFSAEVSSSPIGNLFKMPKEIMLTLHRLYFEISRLLKDKHNNITCTHPLRTCKKLNHACVLGGNIRSTHIKKIKVIIKF